MLHFIPFLVALADFLPYILSSLDTKRVIIAHIISNLNELRVYGRGWTFSHFHWSMLRWLSWFLYLICIVFLLYAHRPEKERFLNFFKKTTNVTFVWLLTLSATLACLLPFYLFQIINFYLGNIDLNTQSYTHSLAFVTGVIMYGLACLIPLFFPQILYGVNWSRAGVTQTTLNETSLPIEVKLNTDDFQSQPTTATSKKAPPESLAQLATEIQDYIETQRPYLHLDFSISTISRHLQVPEHQVNACFSNHFSLSFPAYRNKLRIEYALLLMQRGVSSELTLDAIGTSAGFRSKPIFYAAFRKETGKTPGAYLDHLMRDGRS
jgi:AraC-like DNA-binding protein